MLRLRPSELTLTPEDVEETLRRMAHRQAVRSARIMPSQPHGQPGPPVLRRGPQRAVRDAVTALGDIPILRPRPQPQQAVQSSVDEDFEQEIELQSPNRRRRVDSVSLPVSLTQGPPPTPATASTSSAFRILQLPFRLGRARRESTQEDSDASAGHSTPARPVHPGEDSATTVSHQISHVEMPDPSSSTPTRGPAELRGGGRSEKAQIRHSDRGMTAVSPPSHIPDRSPPPKHMVMELDPDDMPEFVLKGYFKDPREHPKGVSYWFDEYQVEAPQTEPRRRSRRPALPTRSLSSGSAPTHPFPRTQSGGLTPFTGGIFDAGAVPRPPTPFGHRPNAPNHHLTNRGNRFSSEASGASEAFSYYQLPSESRQASSGSSSLSHQAPRYASHGTYHSIHPSQLDPMSGPLGPGSNAPAFDVHHGYSPLPSMPYSHPQSQPFAPPPPLRGLPPFPPDPSGAMNAGYAATQNLPSPLDPWANYYQNLMVPLPDRSMMAPVSPPPPQSQGPQWSSQHNTIATSSSIEGQPWAHINPFRGPPSNYHPLPSTGRPARWPRQDGNPVSARASQRSSENVPMASTDTGASSHRHSQVQRHRDAFERLHNAELPQPAAPRDASNRARTQDTGVRPRPSPASGIEFPRRPAPLSSSPLPQTLPPASGPVAALHLSGLEHVVRVNSRPIPPAMRGNNARDIPSTSLALDHASAVRSPIARATTSARQRPRIPPHQRNQENSGAAEDELMRQEESAINARYGEDAQQEVMDETPPRVGRVERRMFS
ncbi:hypothetical protein FB567DRAFT_615056 [Paraphoma chrysanthemicola]|uniref:Uncharacterized protein n=1 Tax=Paraphoma chrysanthemicola TaxID=798071 RepID=A0A8K0QSJ8_9PLEO|nr:hypothetical protein FB567DRAFT_615056 [Paraphoma chrysanthemicola]